jgi:hypothetical protein
MRWRSALVAAVLSTSESFAQPAPTVEQLVDRLGKYLLEYETHLSSVVAEERFEQRVYYTRADGAEADTRFGEPGVGTPGQSTMPFDRRDRTRLESEIAFIRLPGAEWLAFRDVRKVDGRAVESSGPPITTVLATPAAGLTAARAIAEASAQHNLGSPRTVNVPTAPLEIVHPIHRAAHKYARLEDERVDGTRTAVVTFLEVARPTLVKEPGGRALISSGRVWIDAATGAVWRIEWIYHAERRDTGAPPPKLRVDFAPNRELGMMVPVDMTEVFSVTGGRGEGRARYSNFRRFGTSARIIQQQPQDGDP